MKNTRCVLVIHNERLLGAGIEKLLRRETDLRVLGIKSDHQETLLEAIERYRPDVVVLDEANTDSTKLLAVLDNHPRLRVLLVSADDGLVRTYEARQVIVTQATELIALIKS